MPGFKTLVRAASWFVGAVLFGGHAAAADAYIRVVDVGNGLCVVGQVPGGHAFLYDAGDKGTYCLDAVRSLVPGDTIDVVVLSHSDADHIGELPAILAEKRAGTIFHSGDAHLDMTAAILAERAAITQSGATERNLAIRALDPVDDDHPRVYKLGDATLTLVAGWSDGDLTMGPGEIKLPKPEHNNALSLVVRLNYGGHSALLTGDTVGKLLTDRGQSPCHYAERSMVENQAAWPIRSDVLIGQHHGGNNASTKCFIQAVHPTYVVFSAGHKNYHHPNGATAARFMAAGVLPTNMFRTDRGDDEGPPEWIYGSFAGCVDKPGDDDVEIWLPATPTEPIRIQYRSAKPGC